MANFRTDIQGLRALAVIGVVLYHYSPSLLPSGFSGVDVFFVISGYLMTKIIVTKISDGSFNFILFYKARAERIIPALCIVVASLLIFGFIFIEPLSYKEIGKHSLSSLLFYSNYTYFYETGYFDASAKEKFLLHTWSLSVEWLFYLIYPIILFSLLSFLKKSRLFSALIFLCIASFFFSIYSSVYENSFSYFMIYTRAWEMMLGGVVFIAPNMLHKKSRVVIEYIGIAGVLASFALFSESTIWPGYATLLPVISTALVIYANSNSPIISNRIFQFIGLISYSLYLVHWVFLISCKKLYIDLNLATYLISILLLSTVLHYTIEKRRNFGFKSIVVFISMLYISYYISIDGIKSRLPEISEYRVSAQEYRNKNEGHIGIRDSSNPVYLNSSEHDFDYILIGSSHAKHYYSYIMNNKIKVVSLALDGCNTTKNFYANRSNISQCSNRYDMAVKFIKSHPNKKIIWATNWQSLNESKISSYNDNLKTPEQRWERELGLFINDVAGSNSKIYIVGDTQGSDKLIFECLGKNELPINKVLSNFGCDEYQKKKPISINDTFQKLDKAYSNVTFIDASAALCDESQCKVIVNRKPVYTDYGHLSKDGAEIVGKYIFSLTR